MDDKFDIIEKHLNNLTELSEKINSCQNIIREYEATLTRNHECDKKLFIDLRIKYGVRIDEANNYFNTVEEVKKLELDKGKLKNDLDNKKSQLHIYLTEKSPDDLYESHTNVREIREIINQIKLELQLCDLNIKAKSEQSDKLRKKYRESIAKTEEYFQFKDSSMKTTQYLVDCLNGEKRKLIELRKRYSSILANLEKISSDIHRERILASCSHVQDPLMDCQMTSINQYKIDESENCEGRNLPTTNNVYQNVSENDNIMSQSQVAFDPWFKAECSSLVSPCKSINLPLERSFQVSKNVTKVSNVVWHPLL